MKKSEFTDLLKHLNELDSMYIIYRCKYIINILKAHTQVIITDGLKDILPVLEEDKLYLISDTNNIKAIADNLLTKDNIYKDGSDIYVSVSKLDTNVKLCSEVPFSSYDKIIEDILKELDIVNQSQLIDFTTNEIDGLCGGELVTKTLTDTIFIRLYKKAIPRLRKTDSLKIYVDASTADNIHKSYVKHTTAYGDVYILYYIISGV